MLEIINTIASSIILIMTLFTYGMLVIKDSNNKKEKRLSLTIIIVVAAILNIVIYFYSSGTPKTILTCILYVLFFKYTFNLNLNKAIFNGIIYVVLLVIPDLIVTYSFIYLFGVGKEKFYSDFAGSITCNLCVGLVIILITYLLRKPLKKIVNYKISTNKKLIVMSMITIVFIAFFFYKFAYDFRVNKEVIFYLMAIFAFISILFTLFKEKIENENILNKYDDLLNIMKDYESDVEEQRTTLHETRNELKTVRSMVKDKNDRKQIIKYIDCVLEDKNGGNMKKYSKFKYLPSNGIKGFFYYKFIEAEKLGVSATVFVAKEVEKSFLKDLDVKTFKELGRILGVYLDNAIEASANSDKRQLGLEVYLKDKNIEIIISNTFNNDVDTKKIGRENYSTKGKNRGYGLLLVKRILLNNKRFISKNEIIDNIYVQKLIIKRKTQ